MSLWNWLNGRKKDKPESLLEPKEEEEPGLQSMKKLLVALLRSLRNDHRGLGKHQKSLVRNQKDLAQSLENTDGRLDKLSSQLEENDEKFDKTLEGIVGRIKKDHREALQHIREDMERMEEHIRNLGKKQDQLRVELTELIEQIPEKQSEIRRQLSTVSELMEKAGEAPDRDLLEAIGTMIQDDDRLLQKADDLAEDCPEDCFAEKFTEEISNRLRGMRSERVSMLAANDVELIDSMDGFDPSFHRATGTIPRPEGAEGDGRIERVGLCRRHDGESRVLQRALVSVYEDVEVTSTGRKEA